MAEVIQRLTEAASERLGLNEISNVGIGGFTTLATVTRQTEFKSTVPKFPLEDGSTASDHIINDPFVIKIDGVVADVFQQVNPVVEAYERLLAEVGNVTKYLPGRTTAQLTKVNAFAVNVADITRRIDTAVADGKQALDFFGDRSGSSTIREQFYAIMKAYHDGKALISIQTDYEIFRNMRITGLTIGEDNQTDDISFSMTAEQVRFASIILEDITRFFRKPSLGNKGAIDGVKEKGKQAGTEVERSILDRVIN